MMTPTAEQSALDPNSGDQRRGVMMNAMTTECLNVMEQGARDLLQLAGVVDAALVRRVSEYLGRSAARVRSSGILTPTTQHDLWSCDPGHLECLSLLKAIEPPYEVLFKASMSASHAYRALAAAVRLARAPSLPQESGDDMVRSIAAALSVDVLRQEEKTS